MIAMASRPARPRRTSGKRGRIMAGCDSWVASDKGSSWLRVDRGRRRPGCLVASWFRMPLQILDEGDAVLRRKAGYEEDARAKPRPPESPHRRTEGAQ